jgi:hypothetical protein
LFLVRNDLCCSKNSFDIFRVEIVKQIQEIGCVTFSCGSLAQFWRVNDMRIGRKSTIVVRVARDGATGFWIEFALDRTGRLS